MLNYLPRERCSEEIDSRDLVQLLRPKFSEQGSNALMKEKEVYQVFVSYIREVASNRRSTPKINISLENILQFTTCATEEPILSFEIQSSIEFIIPPKNGMVLERNGKLTTWNSNHHIYHIAWLKACLHYL